MGVRYGWTAVAWGPTGLVGRWAGVHESPLIGENAMIGRGGTSSRGGGGGWGVTDDSDEIMMATKMPYRPRW